MTRKSVTVKELAEALDATLEGDTGLSVNFARHPAEAGVGELAVAVLPELRPLLDATKAEVALVADDTPAPTGIKTLLRMKNARFALYRLTNLFDVKSYPSGIDARAAVDASAVIGKNVHIAPFAVIGPRVILGDNVVVESHVTIGADSVIGADTRLYEGARIRHEVIIGQRCIIHPNAVIGGDGFSFLTPEPGSVETAKGEGKVLGQNTHLLRVASLGGVILGDDVEVGVNSAIDRGTIKATRIGNGTKIDNLVQIGHNVVVGENCLICGLAGIAGSATIGNRVVLAGNAGVGDHFVVGDDTVVAAKSGISKDVPPRSIMMGMPAMPRDKFYEQYMHIGRLKRLYTQVAELRDTVKEIKEGK